MTTLHIGWCEALLVPGAAGRRRGRRQPRALRMEALATLREREARRHRREAVQARRLARVSRMSRSLQRRRAALEAAVAVSGIDVSTVAHGSSETNIDIRLTLREARAALSEPAARLADMALEGPEAEEEAILRALQEYTPEDISLDASGDATILRDLSRPKQRFECLSLEEAFGDVNHVETLSTKRLLSPGRSAKVSGKDVLKALRSCRLSDSDRAHWRGDDADALRAIASGRGGKLAVAKDMHTSSPVKLFTPPGGSPLTALVTQRVSPGEPIAQYAGELLSEEDEVRCGQSMGRPGGTLSLPLLSMHKQSLSEPRVGPLSALRGIFLAAILTTDQARLWQGGAFLP